MARIPMTRCRRPTTKISPLLSPDSSHPDFIFLNAKLFGRVKYLHDHQAELGLNPEQAKLLDVQYKQFVHAGAELPAAKQAQLKVMNARLSTLQTDFTQKLLAAAKAGALHVTDKSALAGLSDERSPRPPKPPRRASFRAYVIPLINTTQQPSLESLSSHATRQALFEASLNRAEKGDANDTRAIISEIAQLRAKKAALFGQPNWADYTLYDQMAKTRKPRSASSIGSRLRSRPRSGRKPRTSVPLPPRRARISRSPRRTGTSTPSKSASSATRSIATS